MGGVFGSFFFKKTTGVAALTVGVGQTHSVPRKPNLGTNREFSFLSWRVSESFFIDVKIKEENYSLGKWKTKCYPESHQVSTTFPVSLSNPH